MVQQQLVRTVFGVLALLASMMLIGFLFEEEMRLLTTGIVERLGFVGLAAILLVTDSLVAPFPPDILLAIIAKSELSEAWPVYVGILGVVSVIAGLNGYGIGRWLGHFRWCQRLFGQFKEDHRNFIRTYGFWGVALGSATPLPYSVTCWTAGVLGVPWIKVFAATLLFRVPRFYVYYWLVSASSNLFHLS